MSEQIDEAKEQAANIFIALEELREINDVALITVIDDMQISLIYLNEKIDQLTEDNGS